MFLADVVVNDTSGFSPFRDKQVRKAKQAIIFVSNHFDSVSSAKLWEIMNNIHPENVILGLPKNIVLTLALKWDVADHKATVKTCSLGLWDRQQMSKGYQM